MDSDPKKIAKNDAEWRRELTPEQFHVLRQAGTEPAFSGSLLHNEESGEYACAACGQVLFRSDQKFDSGSGWPSFFDTTGKGTVELVDDDSHGMHRTEVRCSRCGSHLGHLFDDGPNPTGQRYCMNSLALQFKKRS